MKSSTAAIFKVSAKMPITHRYATSVEQSNWAEIPIDSHRFGIIPERAGMRAGGAWYAMRAIL